MPTVPWPAVKMIDLSDWEGDEGEEDGGGSYMDARGASKKMSRYVLLAMIMSNGALPVATTVIGPEMVDVPSKWDR